MGRVRGQDRDAGHGIPDLSGQGVGLTLACPATGARAMTHTAAAPTLARLAAAPPAEIYRVFMEEVIRISPALSPSRPSGQG